MKSLDGEAFFKIRDTGQARLVVVSVLDFVIQNGLHETKEFKDLYGPFCSKTLEEITMEIK